MEPGGLLLFLGLTAHLRAAGVSNDQPVLASNAAMNVLVSHGNQLPLLGEVINLDRVRLGVAAELLNLAVPHENVCLIGSGHGCLHLVRREPWQRCDRQALAIELLRLSSSVSDRNDTCGACSVSVSTGAGPVRSIGVVVPGGNEHQNTSLFEELVCFSHLVDDNTAARRRCIEQIARAEDEVSTGVT